MILKQRGSGFAVDSADVADGTRIFTLASAIFSNMDSGIRPRTEAEHRLRLPSRIRAAPPQGSKHLEMSKIRASQRSAAQHPLRERTPESHKHTQSIQKLCRSSMKEIRAPSATIGASPARAKPNAIRVASQSPKIQYFIFSPLPVLLNIHCKNIDSPPLAQELRLAFAISGRCEAGRNHCALAITATRSSLKAPKLCPFAPLRDINLRSPADAKQAAIIAHSQ